MRFSMIQCRGFLNGEDGLEIHWVFASRWGLGKMRRVVHL